MECVPNKISEQVYNKEKEQEKMSLRIPSQLPSKTSLSFMHTPGKIKLHQTFKRSFSPFLSAKLFCCSSFHPTLNSLMPWCELKFTFPRAWCRFRCVSNCHLNYTSDTRPLQRELCLTGKEKKKKTAQVRENQWMRSTNTRVEQVLIWSKYPAHYRYR